jgi:sulfur-oxidizing protein SoxY
MGQQRRQFLQMAGMLAAGLVAGLCKPVLAWAATWNKDAFGAKSVADALKSLGAAGAAPSTAIAIEAPQIAENGAVVPVEITSNLPGTTSIAVLVEKNPFPLAGKFNFTDNSLPYVKLNVKMGETADLRVIAWAGGKTFVATREVKVTIGGCGG